MYFGFFELHSCDERSVVRRRRFIQCFRREGLVPPLRRAFFVRAWQAGSNRYTVGPSRFDSQQ